ELSCGGAERSSRRGSQQGNSLAAKQFVSLGNFLDRRAPIEHCQEISSAHGSALLNDVLCDVLRRAGDELVATEREPSGGRRRVGHVGIEAVVLGHKALQAFGYGLRLKARLASGPCPPPPPPQRLIVGTSVETPDARFP